MNLISESVQRAMDGGKLICSGRCGSVRRMKLGDSARFLVSGWPKCCGYTMTLHATKRRAGK